MSGTAPSPKKRILLVDDHEIVRRGLRDFLEREPGFEVCAEAETRAEALAQCALTAVDIALVDLTLGEDSGLDLIKEMAIQFPAVKILVVSMQNEQLYAERALRAGASGFVNKGVHPRELAEAVHCVLNGKLYASPDVTQRIMQSACQPAAGGGNPLVALSDRELAVFERIGRGEGTVAIASKMFLSTKTVETYRARIKTKLNLKNSTELVQRAVQWTLENT